MDGYSYDWLAGVARAAVFTALAAAIAGLLLATLRVRSPRVHRVAWLLVVAQGWLLFVGTLDIEVVSKRVTPAVAVVATADAAKQVVTYSETYAPPLVEKNAPSWSPAVWLVGCWACGAALLVAANLRSYGTVARRLPLGDEPGRADWCDEWQRSVDELAVNKPVRFRITDRLGPLLCYVPFAYYVLAPRVLWSELDASQREAILRHELAHLMRGDLWKSLVIRLLALPQWFNPAVWWAVRRFDEAGEWAADDLARGATDTDETSYARALLRVAECAKSRTNTSRAGAVSARGGVIARRIRRLISPRFKEEPVMKKLVVPALLSAVALGQVIRIEAVAEDAADESQRYAANEVVAAVDDEFPEYRVSPPDVLLVRVVSGQVRENAALRPGDVVVVNMREAESHKQFTISRGTGTITATQIEILVEVDDDGRLAEHGDVHLCQPFSAAGLTLDECKAKIIAGLSDSIDIDEPRLTVRHVRERSLDLQALVEPDGTVDLDDFGSVDLAGMKLAEARRAVEQQLSEHFDDARVTVDVFANNHWVYYVVVQGLSRGDSVQRMPATGNETVLDALASLVLPNPVKMSEAKMWIARPGSGESREERILMIEWSSIAHGTDTSTNHRMLPGDRLFVEFDNTKDDKTAAQSGVPKNQISTDLPADLWRDDPDSYFVVVQGSKVEHVAKKQDGKWIVSGERRTPVNIHRFRAEESATVRDAVARVNGLGVTPVARAWVARRVNKDRREYEELTVDWQAIVNGEDTATNFTLRPGDALMVVRATPKGTVYAAPRPLAPLPMPKTPTKVVPKLGDVDPATPQVKCEIKVIRDTRGELVDNPSFAESLNICDATETAAAIEAAQGDNRVNLLSAPTVVTFLGQTANIQVGQEVAAGSDKEPDGLAVNVTPRRMANPYSKPGTPPVTIVDVATKITDEGREYNLDTGFVYEPGKSLVVRLGAQPREKAPKPEGAVYLVVTPTLLERR